MQLALRFPNWIGDAVMATPTLRKILTNYERVVIVAKPHILPLLERFPGAEKKCILKQEREKYAKSDVGVLLTNSFSSAREFYAAGIRRRIGFAGDMRGFLLSDRVAKTPFLKKEHLSLSYQRLLAPLGIEMAPSRPVLYLSEEEKEGAKTLLQKKGVQFSMPRVVFHTGAAFGAAKQWPIERFILLAKKLIKQGVQCIFIGGLSDLAQLPVGAYSLVGETSLRELMGVLSQASLLITNDSGPMHIADALGTKVLALFGSTSPLYTGPYSNPEGVISKKVVCSPCFKKECPIDFRCMLQIEANEVYEKAINALTTLA